MNSRITSHSNYSASDYRYFKAKGYDDDEILAFPIELDDSKVVDLPLMDRRVLGKAGVNLGNGTEGTLPGDLNLVPSLFHAFDPPLDRDSRFVGFLECRKRRGVPGPFVRSVSTHSTVASGAPGTI